LTKQCDILLGADGLKEPPSGETAPPVPLALYRLAEGWLPSGRPQRRLRGDQLLSLVVKTVQLAAERLGEHAEVRAPA
jgi:hypothetical protein